MKEITVAASPNIALIKYWGKRDAKLNLPNNSSISITLSGNLNTITSVSFPGNINVDTLIIDGEKQDWHGSNQKINYMKEILQEMKKIAGISDNVLIESKNSFPSSAGLASSASGAAALVFALAKSFELDLSSKDLSILARRISGSACRSLFGGFVVWHKGIKEDGLDSFAEQIADESYWPEIRDVIALVNPSRKKISSSEGHERTAKTSSLYPNRPAFAESAAIKLIDAIKARDFNSLAEITMRDSNNMHATMLDSWPPIIYLEGASIEIIKGIHSLNEAHGKNIAAYTFDAGPNAHIITLDRHLSEIKGMLNEIEGIKDILVASPGKAPYELAKPI
ncbi:MAG: diphosphomevalonate decarboxylase [Candidatus Micrarchaeaceae archaeon]